MYSFCQYKYFQQIHCPFDHFPVDLCPDRSTKQPVYLFELIPRKFINKTLKNFITNVPT